MTKKQAIATIEECRDIHQDWINNTQWLKLHEKIGGDEAHHERWIKNYNGVLEVLRAATLES